MTDLTYVEYYAIKIMRGMVDNMKDTADRAEAKLLGVEAAFPSIECEQERRETLRDVITTTRDTAERMEEYLLRVEKSLAEAD